MILLCNNNQKVTGKSPQSDQKLTSKSPQSDKKVLKVWETAGKCPSHISQKVGKLTEREKWKKSSLWKKKKKNIPKSNKIYQKVHKQENIE